MTIKVDARATQGAGEEGHPIWKALADFDARLQRAVIAVAVTLDGAERITAVPLTLRPSEPMAFGFTVSDFTAEEGRGLARTWVLGQALTACADDFAAFIEEAVHAIAPFADGDARSQFNRKTFPQKVDALREAVGDAHRVPFLDATKSIYIARNCLVHRAGVVSDADVRASSCSATPSVTWNASKAFARSEVCERFPIGTVFSPSIDTVTHALTTIRDVAIQVVGIVALSRAHVAGGRP